MPTAAEVNEALAQAHRGEWGIVLAATVRLTGGDLGMAEDATQDAFVAALRSWPTDGIPGRPGAWLTAAARRKALDAVRRAATLQAKLPLVAERSSPAEEPDHRAGEESPMVVDDRLRLVFTCCHPALAPEARTALTLRLVCGLTTAQIARAFLVSEPTMAARLTRAKKKVSAAGIPYRVPQEADLPERLDDVLSVVHLVFTAGHTSPSTSGLVDDDLVGRALDLSRVLCALMPDEPEALGLLALLELTDARRAARVDDAGELVLLEHQDRSRWDRGEIAHGLSLLDRAMGRVSSSRPPGRFVLQATLAAIHAEALTWSDTDWPSAVLLYDRLLAAWPSPVVRLNRAVAVGYASGAEAGLAEVTRLADDPALAGYHYLPAARADLLRRLGRLDEAADAYREALAQQPSETERRFLTRRLADVDPPRP